MATVSGSDRPRRRLWVVSELYYPEQTSTGYFLTHIAEGLTQDFQVHVVAGQPSYSERGTRAPRRELRNATTIHRVRATSFDKDRLALRAVNLLTYTLAVFWFGLVHWRRGDILLVVTNPPAVPFAAGIAGRLKGCHAALLVHDVYPEMLVSLGMLREGSYAHRLLAGLFNWSYGLFARIVVLGRDMAEVVAKKMGGGDRVRIIPNWGDVDEVRPIDRADNVFRAEHSLTNAFVVQFSGNIGRSHDIELVLEAAQILQSEPTIRFLFVGYGGKSGLIKEARRRGLNNVMFLPRQPRERLGEMLAASDVTVISFVDGMYGLSVPSRMYNVMAAGVPIVAVAHPNSELARTVQENDAGWVLAERSPEELAALLRQLAEEKGRAKARIRGRYGRTLVEECYTLEIVLGAYRRMLTQL